jgi:hypothetical protein
MKLLYVAAAFLLACFALSALAQNSSPRIDENARQLTERR